MDKTKQAKKENAIIVCQKSKISDHARNSKNFSAFENQGIRRIWHNDEWWFVIKDVVFALTDSKDPSQYLKRLRSRDSALNDIFKGGVQFVPPLGLEFETSGGNQMIQCWNTQGLFRLIQSIPSKKAEPFKLWFAKVGHERIQEIENPQLAQERMKSIYKEKGYSKEWIEKRVRGIVVRQELTDEWKGRGAEQDHDYAILTNDIMKAAFGKTVAEYKKHKSLKKHNLRDHMDDMELILTMLGEASTTRFTKERDSKHLPKLRKDAKVAGNARKDFEKKLGKGAVSKKNYLKESESSKRKRLTKK